MDLWFVLAVGGVCFALYKLANTPFVSPKARAVFEKIEEEGFKGNLAELKDLLLSYGLQEEEIKILVKWSYEQNKLAIARTVSIPELDGQIIEPPKKVYFEKNGTIKVLASFANLSKEMERKQIDPTPYIKNANKIQADNLFILGEEAQGWL